MLVPIAIIACGIFVVMLGPVFENIARISEPPRRVFAFVILVIVLALPVIATLYFILRKLLRRFER